MKITKFLHTEYELVIQDRDSEFFIIVRERGDHLEDIRNLHCLDSCYHYTVSFRRAIDFISTIAVDGTKYYITAFTTDPKIRSEMLIEHLGKCHLAQLLAVLSKLELNIHNVNRYARYGEIEKPDPKEIKETKQKINFRVAIEKLDFGLIFKDFIALFKAPSAAEWIRNLEESFDSQLRNKTDV